VSAVVVRGSLGWGNRKAGLEAYGPGGRWGGTEFGDLLGDALHRVGVGEGAELIVVAVPRQAVPHDSASRDALLNRIQFAVQDAASEWLH